MFHHGTSHPLWSATRREKSRHSFYFSEYTILVAEQDFQWNAHLLYWCHAVAAIMAFINKYKLN